MIRAEVHPDDPQRWRCPQCRSSMIRGRETETAVECRSCRYIDLDPGQEQGRVSWHWGRCAEEGQGRQVGTMGEGKMRLVLQGRCQLGAGHYAPCLIPTVCVPTEPALTA